MSEQPTVYVIDDHLEERESIAALVSTLGYYCIGFSNAEEFFSVTQKARPGCLILDYRLEKENGLEVLKRLNQQLNSLPTLVVTAHADVPVAVQFIHHGAMTLLEKPYRQDELLTNIQNAIARDKESLDLYERMAKLQQLLQLLTDRQHQIIDLILQGHLNKRIATILEVSQRTVENERATILNLFEVSNAVELATKITEYRGFIASTNQPKNPINLNISPQPDQAMQ